MLIPKGNDDNKDNNQNGNQAYEEPDIWKRFMLIVNIIMIFILMIEMGIKNFAILIFTIWLLFFAI